MGRQISARELALIAVAVAAAATLLLWPRGASYSAFRASWKLTPGVVNPLVIQRTIRSTICASGWTRTIRPPTGLTSALKLRQMREYGFPGRPWQYQEDHLISLELGGHPTDPRNLWPERRPRAEEVDAIENDLRARICSGAISLEEGQRAISRIKHTVG
jgi:hypothetical protein